MKADQTLIPVTDDEMLARFALSSRWIRNDQTIKPDAFIPHPEFLDVSVTRHKGLSEQQIWAIGQAITARQIHNRALYGRADLTAVKVRLQALEVSQAPIPENPNHAIITGWPADKSSQKIIALQLAAAAAYISYFTETS